LVVQLITPKAAACHTQSVKERRGRNRGRRLEKKTKSRFVYEKGKAESQSHTVGLVAAPVSRVLLQE